MSSRPEHHVDSSKRQPSRSVSLLTPEQLQRKREQDRESQRQTRIRVKQTIAELESRVESLTQQLRATKLENDSLKSQNRLRPPGPTRSVLQDPDTSLVPMDPSMPVMDVIVREKCPPPAQYNNVNRQFSNSFVISSQISTQSAATGGLLDPNLLAPFPYNEYPTAPLSVQVWEAKPFLLPATCRMDKIFLELIEARRVYHAIGGNEYEFGSKKFPSVAALLNPENFTTTYPLTSALVTHVIYVLTVSSLPEQIACMYVMATMLRWQITGTEEDYDAMPDWLKPNAAQLVTAHPIWMDIFPWPKARDRLCRNVQYHDKYEDVKTICNQSICVNWPYEPFDTLISISGSEYVVNPVFITHVRNLDNWTLGQSFLDMYPEFVGEVNLEKPRTGI